MSYSFEHLVPDFVKAFQAYIPSKPDEELKKLYHCNQLYRLNNNENPLGPCSKAQKIISDFNPIQAAVYPSGDAYYLREKLAKKYGLNEDQFIVGNGANEVISFVIKAFCQEGDNIVTADKTFAVYEWVAEFSGFKAKLVPLVNYTFDDEGILAAIDDKTKIIFICNPNNPTGTYWNVHKLRSFLDRVDNKQIVVVDEAYFEFVDKSDFPDGIQLLSEYPNLVVFRTFSKMYGLAGLRIGYLVTSNNLADIIRKTCVVYSVNSIAQEAAFYALDDEAHIRETRKLISEERTYLTTELDKLGVFYVAGEANYIMVKLPINDTLAYRMFMAEGVMIRSMTGFRFPNFIRVTLSHHEKMVKFIEALKKILKRENHD